MTEFIPLILSVSIIVLALTCIRLSNRLSRLTVRVLQLAAELHTWQEREMTKRMGDHVDRHRQSDPRIGEDGTYYD